MRTTGVHRLRGGTPEGQRAQARAYTRTERTLRERYQLEFRRYYEEELPDSYSPRERRTAYTRAEARLREQHRPEFDELYIRMRRREGLS
jgi:hypothetical protein